MRFKKKDTEISTFLGGGVVPRGLLMCGALNSTPPLDGDAPAYGEFAAKNRPISSASFCDSAVQLARKVMELTDGRRRAPCRADASQYRNCVFSIEFRMKPK